MSAETEEFLAHFGVKGMKWGKSKASSSSIPLTKASTPSRKEIRTLDKVERAKQSAKRDATIEKARVDVEKAAIDLNAGRKQYKTDKKVIGKVAAREILDKKNVKFNELWDTASQSTAKEATQETIALVGLTLVSVALGAGTSALKNR